MVPLEYCGSLNNAKGWKKYCEYVGRPVIPSGRGIQPSSWVYKIEREWGYHNISICDKYQEHPKLLLGNKDVMG